MGENKNWVRLIQLSNGQTTLLTKDESEDEDTASPYQVKVTCDFEGARGSIALGFKTEDKRDDCFDNYSIEQAEQAYNSMAAMFEAD